MTIDKDTRYKKAGRNANGDGSVSYRASTNRWHAQCTYVEPGTEKSKRMSFYGKTEQEAMAKMLRYRSKVPKYSATTAAEKDIIFGFPALIGQLDTMKMIVESGGTIPQSLITLTADMATNMWEATRNRLGWDEL